MNTKAESSFLLPKLEISTPTGGRYTPSVETGIPYPIPREPKDEDECCCKKLFNCDYFLSKR